MSFILLMVLPIAGASADVRGECNEATATALGEEHDLNPFAPIVKTMSPLCGEFLGPGSEAMVARAVPATCGGYSGWAVFWREADGSWRLVWKYKNGQTDLVAVGNDLEETNRILGPRDPRCAGETATKSRIWHWDGQKFVTGPWTLHPLGLAPTFKVTRGRTSIICTMADDPKVEALPGSIYHNGVSCLSSRYLGRLRSYGQKAELTPSGRVKTCQQYRLDKCFGGYCGCGEDFLEVHSNEQVVVGRFTCRVLKNGVECVNPTGQGFVINPRKIKRLS